MKNKLAAILSAIILLPAALLAADTYTTGDMILTKPGKSSFNWDGKVNGNFDIISASAPTKTGDNDFTGANTFDGKTGLGASTAAAYGIAIGTSAVSSQPITFTQSGPLFNWTSGGSSVSVQGIFSAGGGSGLQILDNAFSWNGRLDLGTLYGPKLYGKGAIGAPLLGLNDSTPQYALDVTGGGHFTSSMTVDAGIYGNLTGNVTGAASLNVLKAGDEMTGDLALPNLTATYGVSAATGVFTSSVTASAFYGDGSNLTGVVLAETDPIVGAVNGIVKADGAGNISAASAGTDYLAPDGDGSGLSGVIQSTATGNYLLRVATATYLATAPGACGAGEFINALTADGTKTCATPAGGGDAVLASTQTWTGDNTFTGSVTASSFTATTASVSTITINTAAVFTNEISTIPAANAVYAQNIVKAYLNYNLATSAIRSSFNVASVAKNATGNLTIYFQTPMESADYAVSALCKPTSESTCIVNIRYNLDKAANSLPLAVGNNVEYLDSTDVSVIVTGKQ